MRNNSNIARARGQTFDSAIFFLYSRSSRSLAYCICGSERTRCRAMSQRRVTLDWSKAAISESACAEAPAPARSFVTPLLCFVLDDRINPKGKLVNGALRDPGFVYGDPRNKRDADTGEAVEDCMKDKLTNR